MAKGAFNGVLRGKMGNTVFYKIKNSNDKEKQGLRPYVAKVSNPKTESQATQRMKMTAATNFYRMMSQVLNNAYQSEKYGTRSRDKFMSLAMQQTSGIPFIDKGDNKFYPGEYQISSGSLLDVSIREIDNEDSNGVVTTSLNYGGSALSQSISLATLSQQLINNNFGLLNKDRITFVAFYQNENGTYSPVYSYIVLDTEDETTSVGDLMTSTQITLTKVDGYLAFQFESLPASNVCVGAAIIISRAPSTNSAAWLRSNATVFVTDAYKDALMSTSRFNAAIETYTKSTEVLSSDWYLNLGIYTNPNGSAMSGSLTITSVSNTTYQDSGQTKTAAIIYLSDGTARAGRYNGEVVRVNGSSYVSTGNSATTQALNAIKTAVPLVTNWYNVPSVQSSGGDDPDIERP